MCLPQKPRTTEDSAAFKTSLNNMGTWYFHPHTIVLDDKHVESCHHELHDDEIDDDDITPITLVFKPSTPIMTQLKEGHIIVPHQLACTSAQGMAQGFARARLQP